MKMEIKIDKKDCLLKELKVPKGYRIIEDYELLKESRTNKEIGEITKECWVWCNTSRGKRAAGFGFNDDGFLISGNVDIDDAGRSRGVFVKED